MIYTPMTQRVGGFVKPRADEQTTVKSQILSMIREAESMRQEDEDESATANELGHDGSSWLPTTADEEGRVGENVQDAIGADPNPKPTAVKSARKMCELGSKPKLIRPAGKWPDNWGDAVHGDDGGCDKTGVSFGGSGDVAEYVQDGIDMLKQLVAKLFLQRWNLSGLGRCLERRPGSDIGAESSRA